MEIDTEVDKRQFVVAVMRATEDPNGGRGRAARAGVGMWTCSRDGQGPLRNSVRCDVHEPIVDAGEQER